MSIASRLAEVEADIVKVKAKLEECRNAQSYGISGRTITKVQYNQLRDELKELRVERARLTRKSNVAYPEFPPAS